MPTRIQGLITPDWCHIGAVLANSDDDKQVAFFKGFVAECLTWTTRQQVEQQLITINDKLSPKEIEVLSALTYKKP